jgi:hypothetical protein
MSSSLGALVFITYATNLRGELLSFRGGPAGCVTAGRLAYADPNLKVMLIEGTSDTCLVVMRS